MSRAIEFVFLFTLAGGLLVLQAAIAATQDERKFDAAILRTLGASQRQLAAAQIAEFLLLGALAGVVAAAGAHGDRLGARRPRVQDPVRSQSAGRGLRHRAAARAAVTLAGWIGTRATTRLPPLAVIRQLG